MPDLLEGKVVLVDVSGLGSTEEVLVASFLTRQVLDHWSDGLPQRARPPRADARRGRRARGGAAGAAAAARTASPTCSPAWRGRAASSRSGSAPSPSSPKLLDDELLSQFNTFFILGLADEKDRNILRGSAKQDISALGPEIQTLMPGECVIANLAAPFAVPAKVVPLRRPRARATEPPPAPRPVAAPNVAALVD